MKPPCPHCGNNPVPHFLNWYFESVNVILAPLRRFLLYNRFSEMVQDAAARFRLALGLTRLFKGIGVITENSDRSLCKISRAGVLWEEAERRGIAMIELKIFGRPFDTYIAEYPLSFILSPSRPAGSKIKDQRSGIVFSGLPRPAGYNRRALDSMDDKFLLKKKLAAAGIPVPRGGSVSSFRAAKKIFANIHKPVIVKPRAGSRGRHSTTYVTTERELREACGAAKQLCHWIIVEEQLFGPVYRATVIDFKIQGVLRGDVPSVTGDGKHSVRELVGIKNSSPHEGVQNIVLDERAEAFVTRELGDKIKISRPHRPPDGRNFGGQANFSATKIFHKGGSEIVIPAIGRAQPDLRADKLMSFGGKLQISNMESVKVPDGLIGDVFDYIPDAGQVVALSEKIGVSYGGSSSEDFDICHPENKALFENAARAVGDPIIGFDFIIEDITRPWSQQRCGFIEANSLPFINLHHNPLRGQPRNVAAAVWDLAGFPGVKD